MDYSITRTPVGAALIRSKTRLCLLLAAVNNCGFASCVDIEKAEMNEVLPTRQDSATSEELPAPRPLFLLLPPRSVIILLPLLGSLARPAELVWCVLTDGA